MSLLISLGILVFIPFSQGQWPTGGGTNGNLGGGGAGQDVLNGQSAPAQLPSIRQQQLQQTPGFPQQLQQTNEFPQQFQQPSGLPQNFQTLPQQNNFLGGPLFPPQFGGSPGFPGGQQFQLPPQQPFLGGAGGQGGQGQGVPVVSSIPPLSLPIGTQGQFSGNGFLAGQSQGQGGFLAGQNQGQGGTGTTGGLQLPTNGQGLSQAFNAQPQGNLPQFNQGFLAGQNQGQGGPGTTGGLQLPTNGQGLPQAFNGQTQNQGASLPAWMQTGNGQFGGLPTSPLGQTSGLPGLGTNGQQFSLPNTSPLGATTGQADPLSGLSFPDNSGQSTSQGNTGSGGTGVPDFSSLLNTGTGTGSGAQPFDFSSLFGNNGNTGGTGQAQGTQTQPQLPPDLLQGLQALQGAGPSPGTSGLNGNQGGNPLSGLTGAQGQFGGLPSMNLGGGANSNSPFSLPSAGLQSSNPSGGLPNFPLTGNGGNNPLGLPSTGTSPLAGFSNSIPSTGNNQFGAIPGLNSANGAQSTSPLGNLPAGNQSPMNMGLQGLLGRSQGNNQLTLPGGSQLPGMQANSPFNANPFANLPNMNLTGLPDPLGGSGLPPFLPPGFPMMGSQFPSNIGATQGSQPGTSAGTGNNQDTPGVFNPPAGMDFLQGLGTDANPFPGTSGSTGSTSGISPLSGPSSQSSGLSPFSGGGLPASNPSAGGGNTNPFSAFTSFLQNNPSNNGIPPFRQ